MALTLRVSVIRENVSFEYIFLGHWSIFGVGNTTNAKKMLKCFKEIWQAMLSAFLRWLSIFSRHLSVVKLTPNN
jgi:hypothetical protein